MHFSFYRVILDKHGSLVKRLRRRPLTAESGVRFPYKLLRTGYPMDILFLFIRHNINRNNIACPYKMAGFLTTSKGNPRSWIPFLFFFFLFIWKSLSNVYSYIRSSFRLHKFFQLRGQLLPVFHIFHDCFFHRINFILDLCQLRIAGLIFRF